MKRISLLFRTIVESLIRNIGGGLGRRIRFRYYRKRLGACGKNVIIDLGVIIQNPSQVFLGDKVWLDNYVVISAGEAALDKRKFHRKPNDNYDKRSGELHIENGVHIGSHSVIQAHGGVFIGRFTCLTSGVKLYSMSHHYRNLEEPQDQQPYFFSTMAPVENQYLLISPVSIGEGCAVGLNSVILPGTNIPDDTWVGVSTFLQPGQLEPNTIYKTEGAKFHKLKKD